MIIATPLDLPKIEPDSWDTFWKIWNAHAGPVVKTKSTSSISKAKIGVDNIWLGLDVYSNCNYNFKTSWDTSGYDISNDLPNMYLTIKNLPIQYLYKVRIVHSLKNVAPHTDDNADRWTVRNLFYCSDPSPQLYFTKPNNSETEKKYLNLPLTTNWFAYNDKLCWHGSDYKLNHPKFLIQIYSFDNFKDISKKSIEKYKDFTIEIK